MNKWVVTGANKGIGLEIVKGLLKAGNYVFLGSRDVGRGSAAIESLSPEYKDKVEVLQLDVTSADSIASSVESVKSKLGGDKLTGLVNNAGSASSFGWSGVDDHDNTIDLNYYGVKNCCDAFIPMIKEDGGRVVMLSSGAAPNFVEKLNEEWTAKFVNPKVTLEQIEDHLASIRAVGEGAGSNEEATKAFGEHGLGEGGSYGCSKAALNLLTMNLAAKHPGLCINACSPGFIETDLTRPFADAQGKKPIEMGMLPVAEGSKCPLFLALGEVPTPPGEGYYYGSDCLRSPLHVYRKPGTEPYDGKM